MATFRNLEANYRGNCERNIGIGFGRSTTSNDDHMSIWDSFDWNCNCVSSKVATLEFEFNFARSEFAIEKKRMVAIKQRILFSRSILHFALIAQNRFGQTKLVNDQFVERFDVDLVRLPVHLPSWFVDGERMVSRKNNSIIFSFLFF